jgi:hypothetical protein
MVDVLREDGDFLRVAVIYERVQQMLEGPVNYQHVRDFLNHRSRREKQLVRARGLRAVSVTEIGVPR